MEDNSKVEIKNAAALAAENERLMNQALVDSHRRRQSEIDAARAAAAAEQAANDAEDIADEAELSALDEDEEESELKKQNLAHEHDDLMNATGIRHTFLTLQYNSRVVVVSDPFNYLIIFVIIVAGINVGVQTYSESPILDVLDSVILVCFSVEVILKVLAEGFYPWLYWTGRDWKWNNFDFTIVFMSLPFWGGLFGSGSLALLRLVRLMRLGKLIKKIPALQMIVQGLTGGLSSIGYILILLFLVYYLFAVVGFYFFGENDPFNFGTIPMAMISLFRCSTLDAWSDIMNINIFGCSNYPGLYVEPTEDDPDPPSLLLCENSQAQLGLAGIYFLVFIVISAMVMLSLFIGTVTMSMNQSMENLRLLSEKKRKREAFLKNKAIITAQVATDATTNGSIRSRSVKSERPASKSDADIHEIKRSLSAGASLCSDHDVLSKGPMHDTGPHAALHRAMYVQSVLEHQQDEETGQGIGGPFAFATRFRMKAKAVFMIDKTAEEVLERQEKTKRYLLLAMGENVPESTSEEIMRGHSLATLKYLLFCNQCRRIADDERFVNFVTLIIVLAGVVVGFQTDPRALAIPELAEALMTLNKIILAVFTLECFLKIVGEGLTPLKYFNDGWNRFDFLIVVGSYIPGAGSLLVILRLLRLLRVLKLVRSLPQLAVILSAMMLGLGSIGYIAMILFLVFYVFAILGIILFGTNDPWHFGTLHMAMLTLFRISTLDDWHKVLYINMFGCDSYAAYNSVYADYPDDCKNPKALGFMAVVYFVLFVIVGAQVLLTLFIGVVTTSMDQASESKKALEKLEDRVQFVKNRYSLTDIQIDNFRNCFKMLDLDNGGTIEEEELKIGLRIVDSDIPDEEISARMKAADPSVDGVDLVGFILFMCNLPKFKQKRMFLKVLSLYRAHKKKKLETARRAHFYERGLNRLGEMLSSPRSLISPRSKTSAAVHPEVIPPLDDDVQGCSLETQNFISESRKSVALSDDVSPAQGIQMATASKQSLDTIETVGQPMSEKSLPPAEGES